jgi:predicted ArsR family transcriptional regulator
MTLSAMSPTRRAIVLQLKTSGPASITDLAGSLETTASAIRQAIAPLAEEGFLAAEKQEEEIPRRGRKRYVYELTEKGRDQLFPTLQSEFISRLVPYLEDKAPEVLTSFIDEHTANYESQINKELADAPIEERFAAQDAYFTRSGYFPEFKTADDGAVTVNLRHCPSGVLGEQCQPMCDAELRSMRTLFASDYQAERVQSVIEGAETCIYRLAPKSNAVACGESAN